MESLTLQPISKVNGKVNLPGSKSVSNRALLLAALACGETQLNNLLESDDTRHMLSALKKLGVCYQLSADKQQCRVHGLGGAFQANPSQVIELFLGNAGTAMRPLTAALCLGSGDYILSGEPRMKERPIGHLVDALRQAGAEIEYLEKCGYPPLQIKANGITACNVTINGSISSQFLTAFLMAAPLAKHSPTSKEIRIKIEGELVSKPYIDITLHMMKQFGVRVEHINYQEFIIPTEQHYISPNTFLIEGDASSASYFLAAAAIKGGEIKVTGIGRKSVQGDIAFADALEKMGAEIEWGDEYVIARRKGPLQAIDLDFNHIPDAAMTIATTALFAQGTTVIRNVYNWRVKETDRLSAMATELRKVGATVEEGEDYIMITPPLQLQHAIIDTYDDHRMAMCFSLVALSNTAVTINDPGCCSKTFPNYFEQLLTLRC